MYNDLCNTVIKVGMDSFTFEKRPLRLRTTKKKRKRTGRLKKLDLKSSSFRK